MPLKDRCILYTFLSELHNLTNTYSFLRFWKKTKQQQQETKTEAESVALVSVRQAVRVLVGLKRAIEHPQLDRGEAAPVFSEQIKCLAFPIQCTHSNILLYSHFLHSSVPDNTHPCDTSFMTHRLR